MAPIARIGAEDLRLASKTSDAATRAPFENVRMIAHQTTNAEIAFTAGRNELHQTIGSDIAKYAAAVFGYSNEPLNR